MITLNIQNRSPYAKVLAEQSSGQKPLYLGPAQHGLMPSADISVDQFLAYFDTLCGYTKQKRAIDGLLALVVISDKGVAESTCDDVLKGMAEGYLGEDAKTKALAFIAQRKATAEGLAAVAAERRALLTGAALRSTSQV